jgi:hypothetical protein
MDLSCYVNEHFEEEYDVPEVFILADIESSQCERATNFSFKLGVCR